MKYFIIDGNSIMNRAYYGMHSHLTSNSGISTGAIYGFLNIYMKNVTKINPDIIAVAFDLHAPTFRHKASAEYKANRKPMDPELRQQMPYIKEILKNMGVKILECEGFEADDVIGSFAKNAEKAGGECYILTGDRDILQLLTDKTSVLFASMKGDILYTPEVFKEEYGFNPINLIDFKAIAGDSSDNYKGVPGVGQKGASELVKEFGTLENIYANFESSDKIKAGTKKKLEAGREDAKKCKFLATISTDAPIDTNFAEYGNQKDDDKLVSILLDLNLVSIIDKMNLTKKANEILTHGGINSDNSSEKDEIKNKKPEINGEEKYNIEIFSNEKEICSYIFEEGFLTILKDGTVYKTSEKDEILEFFESKIQKITITAKPHYRFAFANGRNLKNIIFDAEIAGYLLSPLEKSYDLKELSVENGLDYDENCDSSVKAVTVSMLYEIMKKKLSDKGLEKLFDEIELPLTEVLASMENDGVKVDTESIKSFGEELSKKADECKDLIYHYAGKEFNILSPKQLGTVLFEDLGLPTKKKTKTGYSTSAEVLESLQNFHPIIDQILNYRQYTKLMSTYVDGLLKEVADDGRIHTNFKQTETRTGRISSTEPNLQNIPVRTDLGRNMRKFFIAEEGNVLVDADYSQIELRVLSNISGDENMQNAFLSGKDIHTQTAAQVMGIPEDMVTHEMRSAAKAVNFGIIYGIGAFSLSKNIGVSVAEAKRYIENYLGSYPKVSKFMDKTVEDAKKTGLVRTYYGRIRPVPELLNKNKNIQAAGKRIAMNTPVQGTAADIIKKAMINVYKKIKQELPEAKLILQIHDELIVECPESSAEKAKQLLESEMENVLKMRVPLVADANIGKSWFDAKE